MRNAKALRRAMPAGIAAAASISIALIVAAASSAYAASSTTTIRSSLNPSKFGQAVTFTATVYGSNGAAPAGTITFRDGGSPIGSPINVDTMVVGGAVSGGTSHTCAVTAAGSVKCWGDNSAFQLGDGSNTQRTTPVDVLIPNASPLTGVVAIATGGLHTCAVMADGGVKCWGWNDNGQLGTGDTNPRNAAVDVSGLTDVVAVAAGERFSCALTAGGKVKCWGQNDNGQLGDGTTTGHTTPADVLATSGGAPLTGVAAIAAGVRHACAQMTSGGVKCWGDNGSSQLGDGTSTQRTTPVDVLATPGGSALTGVAAITAGSGYSCAQMTGGGAKCWGGNGFGNLGDGTNNTRTTPVDVLVSLGGSALTGVAAVVAGNGHTCALMAAGGVKCWGFNLFGQLGNGTTSPTTRLSPVDVLVSPGGAALSGVVAVGAGNNRTCALTASGGAQCWGGNSSGELGDNSNTQRTTPVGVSGMGAGTVRVFGEATITTSSLTIASHTVTAEFDGSTLDDSSASLTQTVNELDQTVSFSSTAPSAPHAGDTYLPAASATSGLTVALGASGVCSFDGTTVTFTTAGVCTVTADQAGDATHSAAPQVTQEITVIKTTPTVTLDATPNPSYPGQSVTVTATISKDGFDNTPGGTMTVDFGDGSGVMPVALSGGVGSTSHSYVNEGSFTITATYSGDTNYNGASNTASQTVSKLDQTISFTSTAPSNVIVGGGYAVAATATSGLTVTFGASGACSYSSNNAVHFDAAGSCTVTADQAGNSTYNAAPQATQTFSIGKASSATVVQSFFSPSVYGEAVSFKALVSGSTGGAPTGTMQLKDGGDPLGGAVSINTMGVGQSAASGFATTCVVAADGGVKCWGNNSFGQVGDDTFDYRNTPADVLAAPGGLLMTGAVAVAVGENHTCALTTAGGVRCWGWNNFGQLGDGTVTTRSTPVDVLDAPGGSPLTGVLALQTGFSHTCALTASGGVMCWGKNDAGQLGNGAVDSDPHPTPAAVPDLTGVVAIASDTHHTCALTAGGGARCWGANGSGQLGDGTTTTRSTPVAVLAAPGGSPLTGVVAMAAGDLHTCALVAAGGAKCWGDNGAGQLGDGTTDPHPTPADVLVAPGGSPLMGVVAIDGGSRHTCALMAGGGVQCWGSNFFGQLGIGGGMSSTPAAVSGLTGVAAITAGYGQTCALTAAGAVQCLGWNDWGQLGDGTITGRNTPVYVVSLETVGRVLVLGEATVTTTSLDAASHTITAEYSGGSNHTASTSDPLTQTVTQADQTVSFTSSAPASPSVGATYTPTATATSGLAAILGVSGDCSLSSGTVTFTAATSCTVTADQAGNGNYTSATQATQVIAIAKAATTVAANAMPATVKAGHAVTLRATVTAPSVVTAGGTVTFKNGSATLGTANVVAGAAQISAPDLAIGSHVITAEYGGDSNLTGSSNTAIAKVTAAAGAQNEVKVNTRTNGAQDQPAIARLTSGYVIAWTSAAQDGSGDGIYMQRYTAAGAKVGVETKVNATTASDQSDPAVAGLASGTFVVVFQSASGDGNGMGIYGQVFRANGTKSGKEFRVNTTTRSHQSQPAVAALADGGFVVTWVSSGQDGAGLGIYAQVFTAAGKPEGAEFKVNKTTAGNQTAPAVAGVSNGFVVAWQGADDSGQGIFMQRYTNANRPAGAETQVNKTEVNDQMLPSIAPLAAGGFIIAWQSNNQDGSKLGTYMQRFVASGAKAGNEIRINTTTANDQAAPAIAGFTDEGFVAVWQSRNQDGSRFGVVAQVFDNIGRKVNAEFVVNAETVGDQLQPVVTAFAGGRFTAAWTSNGQDGSATGIYAQRLLVPMGD